MIKLIDILKEAMAPKDKMIIMAGGAGSGKSTLINKINNKTIVIQGLFKDDTRTW